MTQVRSPTSFSLLSNGPQQLDWLSLCHYIKLWVRTCRLSDISWSDGKGRSGRSSGGVLRELVDRVPVHFLVGWWSRGSNFRDREQDINKKILVCGKKAHGWGFVGDFKNFMEGQWSNGSCFPVLSWWFCFGIESCFVFGLGVEVFGRLFCELVSELTFAYTSLNKAWHRFCIWSRPCMSSAWPGTRLVTFMPF